MFAVSSVSTWKCSALVWQLFPPVQSARMSCLRNSRSRKDCCVRFAYASLTTAVFQKLRSINLLAFAYANATRWFHFVLSTEFFPRKEVIQPHLPVRLPCYDFTPVTNPALGRCLPKVSSRTSGVVDFHGVTGGVYKTRERIQRSVLICVY